VKTAVCVDIVEKWEKMGENGVVFFIARSFLGNCTFREGLTVMRPDRAGV
jgi:hypothetical protein